MATGNELQVALRLRAQTEGKEDVDALGKSLSTLGAGADDTLAALERDLTALTAEAGKSATAAGTVGQKLKATGDAADDAGRRTAQAGQRAGEALDSLSLKLSDIQKAVLTYLGLTNVGPMIRGVADTADAYKNLQARIRLVTGEGAALQTAMQGVERVATETNSVLESTGELFTRLYQAGKDLKMTQDQALSLTQTINQAIQVSGASAESADAATTQLIQGLQSGVLRGDEFNSVMEQSPRLARAMADGLGISIGKLRELANAGGLTSQVVIQALQSQARVVSDEYSKMPETVGRAITNLRNQWMIFIGQTDQGMGASSKAAEAINLLAGNLDLVAKAALAAGKAWLAYRAYNIADEFLVISKAAQAAALAKAKDTGATIADTVATQANSLAQKENAAARNAAATASANMGNAAGKLGSALSMLKGFGWAALLTNLPEIGTWLGESTAKLMGYGKIIKEQEQLDKIFEERQRANAAALAEQAAKTKAATDAALGLNDQSRAMIAAFEADVKAGKTVTEAVGELAKALQLGDLTGIRNAGAALDALGLRGKLSADQIQQAYAAALQGKDLQVFITNARVAFDGTEQGARRLAEAIQGALAEAVRRTGKDMNELTTGVSSAARAAINDVDLLVEHLDELKKQGIDTKEALAGSLDKATEAANTEAALQEVIQHFKDLGEQGLITGEKLKEGLEKAQKKLDELKPGINSLQEAYSQLGIKSAQQLKEQAERSKQAYEMILRSGKATTDELKRAFIQYAQDAIAANGGVASEALKIQAAMRGVVIETDAAGQSTVHLADTTNELRDAQQRPDSPPAHSEGRHGGSGGSGGDAGGSTSGGDGSGPARGGNGTGDNTTPGTVQRDVFGFSFDNEQIGRANGVAEKDLSAFSERFGTELQKQLAKMPRTSVQTGETYRNNWNSAFLQAVKNANADAKRANAPKVDTTSQTVKVEITLPNGQKASVTAANKQSADDFVTQLKRARSSAS